MPRAHIFINGDYYAEIRGENRADVLENYADVLGYESWSVMQREDPAARDGDVTVEFVPE